jgi:MFS family permease
VGRRPLIVAGWVLYAAVYAGFAAARPGWTLWALVAAYGVVFGLTEGVEKALVADLVPASRRGTAFGWYHATLGVAALPASVLFGALWQWRGAPAAFSAGALLALVAAAALLAAPVPSAARTAS